MVTDPGEARGAIVTGPDFADDRGAGAARVVDPLALAAICRRVPVHVGSARIGDRASLDDDLVTRCIGGNSETTALTSIHSRQPHGEPSRGGWDLAMD